MSGQVMFLSGVLAGAAVVLSMTCFRQGRVLDAAVFAMLALAGIAIFVRENGDQEQ